MNSVNPPPTLLQPSGLYLYALAYFGLILNLNMSGDTAEIKDKIELLTQELKDHNYRYYVLADPVISDREFDRLLKDLEALEHQYPQYRDENSPTKVVGGGITKDFNTIQHDVPMLSLGNTYSKAELLEFHDRIVKSMGRPLAYSCELKFDGFAIGLKYKNGRLVQALTRGDGVQGDDVTTNVKTIRSIPHQLKGSYPEEVEVRGEIFMHRKAFEKMNSERIAAGEKPFANPRNSAAGTIKLQEQDEVAKRPLDAFIYFVIGHEKDYATHIGALEQAASWGLPVSTHSRLAATIEEVWDYIEQWDKERKNLSFDIDGVVVKVNEFHMQDELGFTAKSPRWAIAYKFETEQAATTLQSVSFQVGRTGAITPVANLEPILLLGTTVKRASLHNADIIAQLDLHEGDTVLVEKGGEIIPKIVGVKIDLRLAGAKRIEFIRQCPECHAELVRQEGEAAHYCPNEAGCPTQIKGRIEHFISRKAMDIDSLGEGKIGILYDNGLVRSAADLYDLTYEKVLGLSKEIEHEETGEKRLVSFREKTAEKIIESIETSKSIPFSRVLFGLGIRFVGSTVAKKLASHFRNIDALSSASMSDLIAVEEIGDRIAESVVEYFSGTENRTEVNRLIAAGLCMEEEAAEALVSNALLDKKFVVSGVFSTYSRDEIKLLIEQHGGVNVSSISAKTDFVLAGENMGPAKLEKAQKLGISIISEDEFIRMIHD